MHSGDHRSGCPINLSLEILGDKWSLIVVRDVMFGGKRHFRELLTRSEEGIASNLLADRLERLVGYGVLSKAPDPRHKQRLIYSLTEMGVSLLPVLAQLSVWGRRYLPVTAPLAARAEVLEKGGPEMWDQLMHELREMHVHHREAPFAGSVRERLKAAYETASRKAES
ncbi:MAG: helix-turn-helix domain-containing protein [Pseudomonadota bacterium]